MEVPDFKKLKFKGVRIEIFKFEEKQELNVYLIDIELKDIFTLFIENIICLLLGKKIRCRYQNEEDYQIGILNENYEFYDCKI